MTREDHELQRGWDSWAQQEDDDYQRAVRWAHWTLAFLRGQVPDPLHPTLRRLADEH
jgi:hypothetical protein